jgi:hypothetical protein
MLNTTPRVYEQGDHAYIVSPVQNFSPEDAELETFAFVSDVRKMAPNPNFLWLKGSYVEADNPNRNGDQWTAGDLAIKALTPVLCPVTVMHNLSSAVGTIADTKLLTPEKDSVPRARIDTVIALWAHRFPEAAEEARINAAQGSLMCSMECISAAYDCSVCGATFYRQAKMAEQVQWCDHLKGTATDATTGARILQTASRILRNVTFTGVGLIYGTRGARGAYPDAHLEVEELAAFHREVHASTSSKPKRRKGMMEIEDSKYEQMISAKATADSQVITLKDQLATAEKTIETVEAAKVAAETALATEKTAREAAEEKARVSAMRDERLSALGTAFKAKLDKLPNVKPIVARQAGEMSDADWTARLAELSETLAVKHDANETTTTETRTDDAVANLLTREQIANSAVGGQNQPGGGTVTASASDLSTPEGRQAAVRGLVKRPAARVAAK